MRRLAVVLFNLGGPDSLDAVRPFLFNLFNDKAIIGAPQPIRWALAKFISTRRAPVAREIYGKIGGKSPLLEFTRNQAVALESLLRADIEAKVFVAMRYWHPFAADTARAVKRFAPDRVILLPLYPQYSTTTTGSSVKDWIEAAREAELDAPHCLVCCYPKEPGFVAAQAELIAKALAEAGDNTRLLFSAHGLPKKIVDSGDPYQKQVEMSARAVVERLAVPGLDWQVCYQSRVGPLEWIGPSTDAEIARAGAERKKVVLAPIAFVSEHSETLVELDIEYRHLAQEKGVPAYFRVPAVATHASFIAGLARLVGEARKQPPDEGRLRIMADAGEKICPGACSRCAQGGMG